MTRPKGNDSRKIGILAGQGALPDQVIRACETQKRDFFILAFKGQTDPALVEGRDHAWVGLGKIGKALECLRAAKVEALVLAGHLRRPAWSELRPDLTGARWLAQAAGRALGDDSLLRAIIGNLEREGFSVISPDTVAGDALLMSPGVLAGPKPDKVAREDIRRGVEVIGLLEDVGQSVIVQQGLVLGIEAIEGTDALIERCGGYKRSGPGGVLVKLLKPGQETRVDRPTIGLETFKAAAASGLRGIAAEAGGVIFLQKEECIAFANKTGLFLAGIDSKGGF